jgi:cystathionine beta-synthase
VADGAPPPRTILDLVGHTPVIPLHRVGQRVPYRLLAKLEFLNPGGSVKDRIGARMVDDAEARGLLKPGGTIIEATSGNTGVGLALVAAVRGYRSIFVIPDKMSSEKIRLLRAYGARVIVTPSELPPDHPLSHYSVAKRLAAEIPNSYYANQFENPVNPEAHYRSTGPEIAHDGGDGLAAVVATVGTGGTLSGIGRYFKEHRPSVRIVAVDPKGSILGTYFRTKKLVAARPYLVEGIGEDMIPQTMHFQYFDEFVEVTDRESFAMARRLGREEGLFVGGSSGSAVAGALAWLERRPIPEGSTVVIVLPDSGDRYLSKFYSEEWLREKGLLDESGSARDLLDLKSPVPPMVSVVRTTLVRDALQLLRENGFSQLPVLSGDQNVGSITEEEVLRRVVQDETVMQRPVASILGPPFAEVGADTPISELLRRLRTERALLVYEGEPRRPVGLLTRTDLLSFLSSHGGMNAV